jgi:DNA-binding NtrC family response regulator
MTGHEDNGDRADEAICTTQEFSRPARVGPWLLEVGSPEHAQRFVLEAGEAVTLGSSRSSRVRVEDPTVSAAHCLLSADEHGVQVRDLGSKNGVYVGLARVSSAWLRESGAGFVIGRTSICLVSERAPPAELADALPGLVGNAECMRRVAAEVRRHARTRVPVLLLGESGTGKDVVARALHTLGRPSGPYVPLNVSAFPDSLADSELFGHRRGAFTGAVSNRAGAFELADRGTLFLDEIAELSPAVQVKLLRVVEDGLVRPIGGTQSVRIEARILSATWAPLEERVRDGRFRADLFHRLSTVTIRLPPLRQRKSDIPVLAKTLLYRMREEVGDKVLSSAALARLTLHDWPGNVRELQGVLYRAAASATDAEIDASHVQIGSLKTASPIKAYELRKQDAASVLARYQGNISAAARASGVPRSTFRAWLGGATGPSKT